MAREGELTLKQRRFVEEYLKDGNATRAAKAAGYSPKTAKSIATENLSKLAVQAAIREAQQRHQETAGDARSAHHV